LIITLYYEAPSIFEGQIAIFIAEHILIRLLVGEMMRIIVEPEGRMEQRQGGYYPGALTAEESFKHPPVMFQDPVNRFDVYPLLPLHPVTVSILTTRIAEFFINPAPERLSASQTSWRYRHSSFHHISFARQK
jgi:hypothetical protein